MIDTKKEENDEPVANHLPRSQIAVAVASSFASAGHRSCLHGAVPRGCERCPWPTTFVICDFEILESLLCLVSRTQMNAVLFRLFLRFRDPSPRVESAVVPCVIIWTDW